MNWHLFTSVSSFVNLDCSSSSNKWIFFAFLHNTDLESRNDYFLNNIDVWHQTLYKESCHDLETYIKIPLRHVIREWTVNYLPEFLWVELLHVGIHNQNNEPCIEKLSKECTFDNGSFLL